jgi:hypothetical protein
MTLTLNIKYVQQNRLCLISAHPYPMLCFAILCYVTLRYVTLRYVTVCYMELRYVTFYAMKKYVYLLIS